MDVKMKVGFGLLSGKVIVMIEKNNKVRKKVWWPPRFFLCFSFRYIS